MDPVPLDFSTLSAIQATYTNITMRATKPDKALQVSFNESFLNFQDTFRVEYIQLNPLKRFPILDVNDIEEQRQVELYLGNLNPGRDYDISVTSLRDELASESWKGIITTSLLLLYKILQ